MEGKGVLYTDFLGMRKREMGSDLDGVKEMRRWEGRYKLSSSSSLWSDSRRHSVRSRLLRSWGVVGDG